MSEAKSVEEIHSRTLIDLLKNEPLSSGFYYILIAVVVLHRNNTTGITEDVSFSQLHSWLLKSLFCSLVLEVCLED